MKIPSAGAPMDPLMLSSATPPPFLLPGMHFTGGILFLLAGGVGLTVLAPELAAGAFASPRLVAVVHLLTLGWITVSLMGALYQFLPVALGTSIASVPVAFLTFPVFAGGLLVFVAGMMRGATATAGMGAATFGAALLLFLGNLGVTLARAPKRDLTWWALAAAGSFLLVTLVLGLALAGNLHWDFMPAQRFLAVGVHLHVALAGWVLVAVVGVSRHLFPMFLLSHTEDERLNRAAVALLSAGAGVLTVLHHAPPLLSRWLPALLLAAGLLAFLVQARRYYASRHRPVLDPGMRLAAAALVFLAAALPAGIPVAVGGASPRAATAYVLTVILGLTLFVAAHYYKIVPFLVWYHRFGPLVGKRDLPRVTELYAHPAARFAGILMAAGGAGMVAGVASGLAWVVRAGAAAFTLGVAVEAVQMLQLARRHPDPLPEGGTAHGS